MNEVWTGTRRVRLVKRDGDHLIYSTPPFPFHTDGKMSVNTLAEGAVAGLPRQRPLSQ